MGLMEVVIGEFSTFQFTMRKKPSLEKATTAITSP